MNQQNISHLNEFQTPIENEETFFEMQPVQEEIAPVMPLDETPTQTSRRPGVRRHFRRYRVPVRREDKSFNPAFLALALIAVTALGVIAGTLFYRASSENSAGDSEPGNSDTRTVQPQYQFIVDKPESNVSASSTDKTFRDSSISSAPLTTAGETAPVSESMPATTAETEMIRKDSRDDRRQKDETSESNSVDDEEKNVESNNKTGDAPKENPVDDEDEPPPPPLPAKNKNQRTKENKKSDRPDNSQSNSDTQESGTASASGGNGAN
jgi:hypothetical protein